MLLKGKKLLGHFKFCWLGPCLIFLFPLDPIELLAHAGFDMLLFVSCREKFILREK